jgi:AcrR family transcriptional regulator
MNTRERILKGALTMFTSLGFSNVSTEQIARECGVGKATLYRYFPTKNELLLCCVESMTVQISAVIQNVLDNPALSPREKVACFLEPVVRFVSGINPAALADVQRSAPEAYARIEESRRRLILNNLTRIINDGKEAGIIRRDVNGTLVAHVLIGAISHLCQPQVQAEVELPFGQLLRQVLNLLWEGVLIDQRRADGL